MNAKQHLVLLAIAPFMSGIFLSLGSAVGISWTWCFALWLTLLAITPFTFALFSSHHDSAATQAAIAFRYVALYFLAPCLFVSLSALHQISSSPLVLGLGIIIPLLPLATKYKALHHLLQDIPQNTSQWKSHKTLRFVALEDFRWTYQKYGKDDLPLFDVLNMERHPMFIAISIGVLLSGGVAGGLMSGRAIGDSGPNFAKLFGFYFMLGPGIIAVFGSLILQTFALAKYLGIVEKRLAHKLIIS